MLPGQPGVPEPIHILPYYIPISSPSPSPSPYTSPISHRSQPRTLRCSHLSQYHIPPIINNLRIVHIPHSLSSPCATASLPVPFTAPHTTIHTISEYTSYTSIHHSNTIDHNTHHVRVRLTPHDSIHHSPFTIHQARPFYARTLASFTSSSV